MDGFDSGTWIVQSGANRLRRIAGQRVNRPFDRPGTGYGNNTTAGDVWVEAESQLIPAGDGTTRLRMRVEATAISTSGVRNRCRSTGRLSLRRRGPPP